VPVVFGIDTGTENQNRWNNSGPMGTGFVTGATGISHTACGHQKVSAKRAATIVQLRKSFALLMGTGLQTGNGGIIQRDCGPRRKARWK